MADIALRDYDYEIAAMLDAGEFDDAIAHCLHILRAFPKHLQAYRLLAQGLVKSQRNDEAIPVLQRLLSALPDDFDAHEMLSNVYEGKENLEAALWHAKRAFEIKPAEKEVQNRLRDLFTMRDGTPPPIRLTRGALARMYADQPDQSEQAISEIRSILSEKPERVDLQIIMAQGYHRIAKDEEAAQVCISTLEVLPYALEANCILAEIFDAGQQNEQAEIHWARVKELEPYDKRLENRLWGKNIQTSTDDNVVYVLEEAAPAAFLPGWEESLGIQPSPLVAVSAAGPDAPQGTPAVEPLTAMDDVAEDETDLLAWLNETPPAPSDTIGTWLENKESGSPAGDDRSSGETQENQEIMDNSLPLPDWLYNLAKPKTGDDIQQSIDEVFKAESEDWLGQLEQIHQENQPSQSETENAEGEVELPDWLKSVSDLSSTLETEVEEERAGIEPEQISEDLGAELPAWLDGLAEESSGEESAEEESAEEESVVAEQASLEAAGEPEPEPSFGGLEAMEFSLEEETEMSEAIPAVPPGQSDYRPDEQVPDWLKALEDVPEPGAEAFLLEEEESQEETPETPQEVLPAEEEEIEMESAAEELPEVAAKSEPAAASAQEEYRPVEQIPDWLQELETLEPAPAADEGIPPQEGVAAATEAGAGVTPETQAKKESIPDWLADTTWAEQSGKRERGAEEEIAEQVPPMSFEVPEEEEPGESVPEWLVDEDLVAEITGQEAPPKEKPKAFGPGPEWETDIENMIEMAEQMALEETPAVDVHPKQTAGAGEPGEGFIASESGQKKVPDWLLEEEQIPAEAAEPEAEITAAVETDESEEALPDWTAEVEKAAESFAAMVENALNGQPSRKQTEAPAEAEGETPPPEEIPDWMREIMQESVLAESRPAEKEPQGSEGIPDWLKQLEEQPSEAPEAGAQGLILADEAGEEPHFENIDAAIDWLEGVTEKMSPGSAGGDEGRAEEISETAGPGVEEPLLSFEIPREELEESQIELSSEREHVPAASSAWVLESLAAPQELKQADYEEENISTRQMININKAGLGELEQLPSIGFRLAQNIVNYRQFHGEFRTLDDLRNIPKMDASILNEIASYIQFEDMPVYTENALYRGADLGQAKNALDKGDLAVFLAAYNKQISQRANLAETIKDLVQVAKRYPTEIGVWQTLGDAYLQAGKLDEALESYRRAEEILQ